MIKPESFFRRWARLKREPLPASVPVSSVLPEMGALDFSADFSPFMRPEVGSEVRREALRKLFMTDHYRATDGLDVYVGDYSRPELLPAELLSALEHAQSLLAPPEETAVAASAQDSDAA
jgi:hypothetical protein